METHATSPLWSTDEAAKLYSHQAVDYASTAVSWILEYYQQTHPDWSPGSSRIPLIVDVGCGTGRLSALLAQHSERLIGVDVSPYQVEMARQVNARPNVEYKTGSALELSAHCPAGGVDLIVAGMAAHYFDTDEFYSEVRRCLRPGGVLAIVSFWYPGIRHEDPEMATAIDGAILKEFKDGMVLEANKHLVNLYRDLHCPLLDVTRREIELYPEMAREEVRNIFLSVKCLYKDGEESVDSIMGALPPQEKYTMIFKIFGIFCHF